MPKHMSVKFQHSNMVRLMILLRQTLCSSSDESCLVCVYCGRKLLTTNVCTCCHLKFNSYRVIHFQSDIYDFSDYIVSHALATQHRSVQGNTEQICKTCHNNLCKDNVNIPKVLCNDVTHNKLMQALHGKT